MPTGDSRGVLRLSPSGSGRCARAGAFLIACLSAMGSLIKKRRKRMRKKKHKKLLKKTRWERLHKK